MESIVSMRESNLKTVYTVCTALLCFARVGCRRRDVPRQNEAHLFFSTKESGSPETGIQSRREGQIYQK